MKGAESKLLKFMEGSDKRFVIPVYQRNYDWRIENCKQLYDDLIKMIRNHCRTHFFGSIVSVYNPDGDDEEYLIIDGQQRLTTVSLILLAMHNLIKQEKIIPDDPNLKNRVMEDYLVDKYQRTETRIKLKPIKNDQSAFQKLFDESTADFDVASNLTTNYQYFYERIQKQEITVDQLFQALRGLEIINIKLDHDDNPQLIFESLNSTGLDLSEGDKIRNYVLMGLRPREQETYYEKYWNKIEINTGYEVSAFIRDYLSVKTQAIPAQSKVYFTFKAYVEEEQIEIELLLKDLLAYSKWYEVLLTGKTISKNLNACIYRLNRLETTITRPFFLEVLRLNAEGKLSMDEVMNVFQLTETYLFRRTICDLPTAGMNKVFLLLHKEIVRYDGTDNQYVGKFKYAVLAKKDRARFPRDDEFVAMFSERPIYQMNMKNKVYILERFENFGTIETKDVYAHIDNGDYSIEHVMPQKLTPAWSEELGEDYEQIHEIWLDRIGNLTLTGYNSKYSNNTFEQKKNMRNGFIDSGLKLNQYIARQDKWTLEELQKRTRHLMKLARTIWATPITEYQPAEKEMEFYSLDDEVSLSGRKIAKFSYKNMEQPVTSWIDMYERVLKLLHAEDKSVLTKLAYAPSESSDLAIYISNTPNNLRGAVEIDEGIYAERNTSTWLKLSLLKRFFKLYNADPADLVFYVRDEDETDDDDDITGALEESRKRYWTFALDYIHQAHGENGLFSNVNPTINSWISGYFGVSGFSLSCKAYQDSAGVMVSFGKRNKEENKAAFDRLYEHKAEIEEKLGVPLQWNRNDDKNVSNVYLQLDNVRVEDESDWLKMTMFHAEWSKKFYDVIVPLVRAEWNE